MKKKLVFILTCILLLFLIPSCSKKGISLNEGAEINLKIKSEASEVFVNTNFGEIVKNGTYDYKITVPFKKDFNISVSSKGYETNNYLVTVKDIETGSFDLEIPLVQKEYKYFTYIFNGTYEDLKCVNSKNESLGTLNSNKIKFKLTDDELRNGIIIKAKGMEDYVVSLTEQEKETAYSAKNVVLTAKGTKQFSYLANDETYVLNENGEFIKTTKISSSDSFKTISYFSVDKDYTGDIFVNELFRREDPLVINVDKNTKVYGNHYSMVKNQDYISTMKVEITDLIKDEYDWYCTFGNGNKIRRIHIYNPGETRYLIVPKKCTIFAFMKNLPYAEFEFDSSERISFNSFVKRNEYINSEITCLLKDEVLGDVINTTVIEKNNNEIVRKINTKDGFFKANMNLNYQLENGQKIRPNIYNNEFYYDNGVIYSEINIYNKYKLNIRPLVDGKLTSFDSLEINNQLVNKNSDGSYSIGITVNQAYFITAKIGDKEYRGKIKNLSKNNFDESTKTFDYDVKLTTRIGRVIRFSNHGDNVNVTFKSITTNDPNVVFHRIGNDGRNYYLLAEYDLNIDIKIKCLVSRYDDKDTISTIEEVNYKFNYKNLIDSSYDEINIDLYF